MRKVDFEKITLTDDIMFSTVLSDPEKCKEFLQRLLGITIIELEIVTEQKSVKNKRVAKGIRLDIYAKDSRGNVYDLEMQMIDTKELELRSRYYHSEMDGYQIKEGQPYSELKNSIVIFLCCFDLFERNRSVYTFMNQCVEEKDLVLNDKRKTIFVNIFGQRKGISEKLSILLDYLKTSEPTDDFTKRLQEEVVNVRNDQEWRDNYMTWEMKLDYEYRMGEKAGIEQGIQQKLKILVEKKIAKGKTISQIADECEETEEKIKEIIEIFQL